MWVLMVKEKQNSKKIVQKSVEKQSNLWIVLVLVSLLSALLCGLIAIQLIKRKNKKAYADFKREDYKVAIFYTLVLGILTYALIFTIGFWPWFVIYVMLFIICWLMARDISPTQNSSINIVKGAPIWFYLFGFLLGIITTITSDIIYWIITDKGVDKKTGLDYVKILLLTIPVDIIIGVLTIYLGFILVIVALIVLDVVMYLLKKVY